MAQELADKIRAAAQAKGIDPEVALAIARAESSNNPAAQAKGSTAGGLFQVVDKTWKEFGGNPKKKLDADENIRVGTDIIAKNTQTLKAFLNRDPKPAEIYAAHYFGPSGAKTFLAADPATPIVDILGKAAVKANPNLQGKTAGQVLAQLETKMGGKAAAPAPAVSRETPAPTPAEEIMEPALRSGMTAQAPAPTPDKLAALGPGYQAALALSFLADTDEKEDRDIDREPGVAEKWLAEQPAAPSVMAQFADISIKSPFAEPRQPQMFNEGGEVEEESYPDAGKPTVQEVHVAKAMFPDLPVAEAVYILRGGGRQSTPQGEMLSGNIGARIPLGKDSEAMLMLAGSRPEREQSSSKALLAMLNQRLGEGNVGATVIRPMDAPSGLYAGNMSASYPLGEGRVSGNVNAMRTPDGQTKVTGYGVGYGGRVGPGDLSAMIMRQKDGPYSGQIEYRLPIGRADGSPEEGEVARLTPQQIEQLSAREALEREKASSAAFLTPKSGIGRKISTKTGELEAAALQGVSEYPYLLAGSPVDLATMVMRPFGYDVEKPMFGSEDLKERALKAGIRQKPPEGSAARALYELTQAGASAVNPAAPVRGAVKAAEKVGDAARMLEDMTVGNIQRGQVRRAGAQAENIPDTAYDPLRERMEASGNLAYAAKPKGGTFAYTPEDTDRAKPITNLSKLFQSYRAEARDLGSSDEVRAFIEAKAPKYFTTVYGTANDPLRLALSSRRITPFGDDADKFGPFLNDVATQGDAGQELAAKLGFEKKYDESANLVGNAFLTEPDLTNQYGHRNKLMRDISEKMGQEGAPLEARNPAPLNVLSADQFDKYPTISELLKKLTKNQEQMPPNIQQALNTGEVLYDIQHEYLPIQLLRPGSVIEALQQVPANKLKNMSFPEALIQGTQALAPVRDYLAATTLAEKGAKVPRQALDRFTTPVMKAPSFGGKWVTIDDSLGTVMEGKLLNHSVKDYNAGTTYGIEYTGLPYGGKKAFDEGLVRVYSLRDAEGMPKVTLEMAKSNGGKGSTWNVTQIRGRFNSEPPPETRKDIFNLLDKIDAQDGLNDVRLNSYINLPTGQSGTRTMVDWAKEYDLWKSSAE
jgi:hypothetical protein